MTDTDIHPREFLDGRRSEQIEMCCDQCGISKIVSADALREAYGNLHMHSLLYAVAKAEFGCSRVGNAYYDRCKMHYPTAATESDRPIPITLGSMQEWIRLMAVCEACGRERELDIAALRRRLGDAFEARNLATRMRCRCKHRGAKIMIGRVKR